MTTDLTFLFSRNWFEMQWSTDERQIHSKQVKNRSA